MCGAASGMRCWGAVRQRAGRLGWVEQERPALPPHLCRACAAPGDTAPIDVACPSTTPPCCLCPSHVTFLSGIRRPPWSTCSCQLMAILSVLSSERAQLQFSNSPAYLLPTACQILVSDGTAHCTEHWCQDAAACKSPAMAAQPLETLCFSSTVVSLHTASKAMLPPKSIAEHVKDLRHGLRSYSVP